MTFANYNFERFPSPSKDEADAGDHTAAGRRSLGALGLRDRDGGSCDTFTKSPQQTPCHSQHEIPLEQSSLELSADQSHLDANVEEWLNTSTDTGVQNRSVQVISDANPSIYSCPTTTTHQPSYWLACQSSTPPGTPGEVVTVPSTNNESQSKKKKRVPTVQRSTLTPGLGSFFNMARVWCVLALAAPLFSFQPHWALRCTSRSLLQNVSMLFNSAEVMLVNMSVMMERARAQVTRLARQEITRDCFATAMDVLLIIYGIGFMVISMYEATAIC